MREEASIKQTLANRLQSLPAEQVKKAMLKWLREEDNLNDVEDELDLLEKVVNSTFIKQQDFKSSTSKLTPKEKAKAFREWASSHPTGRPLLSDEAISRESIYSNERL